MNYTVGDFIIRIKNAVGARRRNVTLPYTRLSKNLADLLVREKYLKNVKVAEESNKKFITADIGFERRIPTFTDVRIISKPSLRVYVSIGELTKQQNRSVGNLIVSTNSGLMTGKEAIKKGLGGEVLFAIW